MLTDTAFGANLIGKPMKTIPPKMLVALVLLFCAGQTTAETLTSAWADGYENSGILAQNRALLRAADADVAIALAALRPIIEWRGEVGAENSVLSNESSLTAAFTLSSEVTLWDGGANGLRVQSQRETVRAVSAVLMGAEQDVLLRVATAYFDVGESHQLVALETRNVSRLRQQLASARVRFEVGEATRTDISLTEARLATAISQLAAARGDLAVATEAFRAAVGRPPGSIELEQPDMGTGFVLPPRDQGLERAQRDHPDIIEATHRLAAADVAIALAQAALSPTTALRGEYGFNQDLEPGGLLRLRITGPIYSGGALASDIRRAHALRGEALAILRLQIQAAHRQVNTAFIDLEVATARVHAARIQVNAAQIAFNGIVEEASLGSRTQLDVLDAAQELRAAHVDSVRAQVDQMRARVGILHATGLLSAEYLNLPVERLAPTADLGTSGQAPTAISPQGRALDRILER